MPDKIKIKMLIHTGYTGCEYEDEVEVDREDWEAMDYQDQGKLMDEFANEFLYSKIDVSVYVEEE